ncbi:MAG: tetratricopeptide repeat protein [Phycisphaerales bacterium]|nr:MAG: tetratricopeptide repeat protein [Phycisphaerales bacterium]
MPPSCRPRPKPIERLPFGLLLLLPVHAAWSQQPASNAPATQSVVAGEFQIPLPLDMQDLEPKVREAIEAAIENVKAHPADAEAVAELGILYHANLLVELAVPCYRRARELAPGNHQWRYLLAVVARHTGDADTARSELLALRDAGVEYPPVFFHLGEISLDAAELDQAAALFSRMIELAPQAAGGYFGMGRVEAQRGNYEKAVEYLSQARDRAPTSEDVLQQLGLAYRRLAQATNDPELRNKARDTLLAARQAEEILLYRDPWRSAIHRVEVSPAQLSERARILVDRGMLQQAEQIMLEVVARQPNELLFITQLAGIKYRQGQMHEARELCARAVELAPKDPHAWEGLAETRRAVRDYEGALAAVNAALELDPSRLQTRYLRGRILLEAERPEQALPDLQAAVAADPNHAAALVRLADALLRLHRDAEALPVARRAAELDGGSAYAHFEWGIALARSGDLDGSERALRRALELAPNSKAARIYLDWVQQQSAAAKAPDVDAPQDTE